MLPHSSFPPQEPAAVWPADVPCPCCGRTGLPFDAKVSALMDWLGLLKETLRDVEKAVEELVA
jgi:hypothetical protein